jgi:5,10-methylene-tetrahydrofolate dehydrogenase/methenyl tetrahydrofolate cyclohydrolase
MLTILNQERNATIRFSERQTREGRQRLKLADIVSTGIAGMPWQFGKTVDIIESS